MNARLFLILGWVSFLFFLIIVVALNYLIYPRLYEFSDNLPIILIIVSGLIVVVIGGGLILLTLTVLTGFDFQYPHGKKQITVRVLFPIVTLLGNVFRIKSEKIRLSYVALNNAIILATRARIKTERLLILLPHCLQWYDCPNKITSNIDECKRCGKCSIKDLLENFEDKVSRISVATGGTIARKVIVDIRPDLIFAVACERDLVSGINDAYPIPVFGVPNKRPNGPCYNTQLDIDDLKNAFKLVVG